MSQRWSVQQAKAHLSELMRRARAGEPQRIGMDEGCVLISETDWKEHASKPFEEWLVDTAPRGEPLILPSRKSRRGDPFEQPKSRRRK